MNRWIGRARTASKAEPVAVALLLLANLLPLAGVLFFGWDVGLVLITYWLENGIVGLINIPKILLARESRTTLANEPSGRVVYAAFFAVHYGIFWLGHGVFVFVLIGQPWNATSVSDPLGTVLASPGLLLAALTLLISHGASFFVNYIGRGEYLRATPDSQVLAPYGRMFVLHIAIVLGGALVIWQGQPLFAVVLLVVLKTGLDLLLHLREHGAGPDDQGTTGPNGMDTTRAG